MKIDDVSHTVKPALSAKQIMLSLLDSNLYNELEVIEYSEVPSPAITPEMMLDISKIIKLHLDNDDAQGFVVVHGTDTLEETAFFLDTVIDSEVPIVVTGSMKPSKIPKHISTGEAFNSGRSIEGLIEELGVKRRTILDHLNKCVNEGFEIDPEKLLPCLSDDEELHKRIIKAFDKHGVYRLSPVFEELDSEVDYDTLFLYRLYIETRPVN